MGTLSAARLRSVLRAVERAVEFRELSEFRAGALTLVRELVPCETASYNEVRPGASAIVIADPAEWLEPETVATFGRLAGENPLIMHYVQTGDGAPVRFSDFISRRQLHRLALYDELYRELRVEHQLAFVLPSPPGEVVGIALNRGRDDFSDEDAAVLDLVRAPLRSCYERLLERERLTGLLRAYEGRDEDEQMSLLGLSERQSEVMRGVIGGASNSQVALSLGISRRTVEKHLENIYAQLYVTSRTQAIDRVRASGDPARFEESLER